MKLELKIYPYVSDEAFNMIWTAISKQNQSFFTLPMLSSYLLLLFYIDIINFVLNTNIKFMDRTWAIDQKINKLNSGD